ncbi:MAG: hypothetical protein M3040_00020 [Bacteroidota bacterium]|nr:hypothetical protein [Bacteroidota bacterium]
MKTSALTLALSLFSIASFAQKDTVRLKRTPFENKAIVTDRPPQAVYFLLGGSGPALSVNYDRRFGKRVNGAGFAAGLGFVGGTGISVFSIPVSLNYLFGRKSDFIEVAAGTTFITSSVDNLFEESTSKGSGFFYHVNGGYRHQPAAGGFFFRGGISPLFFGGGYITSYYIGFGYNF